MMNMAKGSAFKELINPNAKEFLAPENMIEAIRAHLGKPNLPIEDVLSSVYHSLANSYNEAVKVIENVTVDISFRQLVEGAKDKGEGVLGAWESIKNGFNDLQSKVGCSSGITGGISSIVLAAVAALALKKKKDE
jgi:2-hydroxy-3-keto-5-methylthiopentenyl-1-phosphate phosphatase